jgi:hypothetical protein
MNARAARARSRAVRGIIEQALNDAARCAPRFVTAMGEMEIWQRGCVAFVMPALRDDYPSPLKAAVDLRRRATLSGECDCGATRTVVGQRVVLEHDDDCMATDKNLIAIGEACGVPFKRWVA